MPAPHYFDRVYRAKHDINPKTQRVSPTDHSELDFIVLGQEHPNGDGGQDGSKHQVKPSCAFVSAKFIGNLVPYSDPNRQQVVKREYSRNRQSIPICWPRLLTETG